MSYEIIEFDVNGRPVIQSQIENAQLKYSNTTGILMVYNLKYSNRRRATMQTAQIIP